MSSPPTMPRRRRVPTHAERDAYCKDDFWCEPGARNARNEFKLWLHMESRLPSFLIVPWPFASAAPVPDGSLIDAEMLQAHWHLSKFNNWPGEWFGMRHHLRTCADDHRYNREFFWGLFGSPQRNQLAYNPKYAVPKEFIDALLVRTK